MVTTIQPRSAVEAICLADAASVADAVRAAYEAQQPVYPRGGGTALGYGVSPSQPGVELQLGGVSRIVDYTPRDMTILVEAGVRMADLAATLAAEGQQLPIDVPRARAATIGGVVATNWNGPRRYGHGTVRDYVIGIHAVDGRGVPFKGGGRVVKNVAGYDFCKLLCGSLGTLGVITQLALKVKPLPESTATIACVFADLETAHAVLERLSRLEAMPVSIDLLIGGAWKAGFQNDPNRGELHAMLVVRVEGTEPETVWLAECVSYEMWNGGGVAVRRMESAEAAALWSGQVEFADQGAGKTPDGSPLVLKIAVPPSATTEMIATVLEVDPLCTILAHAGNGIVFARFSKFEYSDLNKVLVGKLRPAAIQRNGSLIVVSSNLEGLTPHLIWGGRSNAIALMERIKQKFDPHGILNPGRFVF